MLFPKIITISGVDGSGKTTISNLLKKDLEKRGCKVYIYHSGALLKASSEPKHKMSPIVGFIAFIKDYLQIVIQYLTSLGFYDYVIFDRFLYDSIVKISYKQGITRIQPFYIFITRILFPTKHLSFLLLLSPSISKSRENEHSKKYHTHKFSLYNRLLQFFPLIVVQSNKPLPMVFRQVKYSIKY